MKGQVAVEYVAIVALSLAILVPVWLYTDQIRAQVDGQLRLSYAKQTVDRLRDAADLVYAQGPPAQFYVDVTVPDGVQSVYVNGKLISLSVSASWGVSEAFATTVGNVTGSLPSFTAYGGPKRVLVKAQQNYSGFFVNVTEG